MTDDTIFTIGHSTRTLKEIEELLSRHGVHTLVDVRSYPGSKYCPQWNQENIHFDHIAYKHLPILGGKRKALPRSESMNGGWRNESFRGYGDYMQTREFMSGIEELENITRHSAVAFMCSEAVWWKCHRSMISDALVARGWTVKHIMDNSADEHHLRDFAVVGETITYPRIKEMEVV